MMMMTHFECLLALNSTQNSLQITTTTATINKSQSQNSATLIVHLSKSVLTRGKIKIGFWGLLLGPVC